MDKKLLALKICLLLLGVIFGNGCISQDEGNEELLDYDHTDYSTPGRILPDIDDWLYQLQNVDLEAAGKTKFDLLVIDYSQDGTDEYAFSKSKIEALKNSSGGKKVVISYISIGKAEDYRYYWNQSWDNNPPSFFESEDPKGDDNFLVHYWEKAWQDIIFGSNHSYVNKILSAGFDGIYLDIIDAYEYYEGKGRTTAAQEMVDFVKAISQYCKVDKNLRDFLIIPQNGERLAVFQDYLNAVDGLGKEDIFYYGNDKQPSEEINYSIKFIDEFKKAGKIVLSVDYCTKIRIIDDYYSRADEKGYVPFSTERDLDILKINPGHEPD